MCFLFIEILIISIEGGLFYEKLRAIDFREAEVGDIDIIKEEGWG